MRLYAMLRISRELDAHASIQRLATAAVARRQRDLYLRLEGAAGMLAGDDAPLGAVAQRLALWSPAMSIMLGTDEIQLNIVGEHVLGLPPEPSVDRGVPWRDVRRA
jgi:alkylation response protein AidB-like acyl-CoA dehydrogenase